MPLFDPQLDDRTFEQILSDLRLRIPRYTKEWTNFNDSDPGMTLLQLFAWLSEMMLFRMNQVPLKNYVKFLKLLGQELAPAQPARAKLTFITAANTVAEPVPLHAQVSAQADDGGPPLIFETERGLDVIQPPLDIVGVFDGASFVNATDANTTPGTTFLPFGWSADPGNALYLGFAPPNPMPPAGSVQFFPQEMTFALFLPPDATAGQPQECTAAQLPPIAPVSLVWEYRPKPGESWQRLSVFEDATAAFTREDYVRVQGPQDIQPAIEPLLDPKSPRFWIRVRIDPPKTYPSGRVPKIDFLRPNTVDAVNLQTVQGEILGVSEGHPNEVYSLQHTPVEPASVELRTEMPNGDAQQWTLKPDFLSSNPDDPVFTLNPGAGSIQFGDGDRGLIPSPTAQVIATSYRAGGGARGSRVGAGSITDPITTLVGIDKVTNERPAVGGADEETLDDLKLKAPALLRRRDRAVTPSDFESFVKAVGGIAGARALPSFHPDFRGLSVPGAITVVIVPDNEDTPPKPSGDLLRAICSMLDEKRLLTTEVFVKGPEYQEIRAEVRVSANPYASFDTVSLGVVNAINAVLDPRARAFGEDLYPTSLHGEILDVPDVVGVLTLNLYVDGRRHAGLQPVSVPSDGLVFGRNHLVTVVPAVVK
jgi:predicted phage baseplate assembly protein